MKGIHQIRRDNLLRIEKECGSASATALMIEMSPAQYYNLRNGAKDSKTGRARGMRSDTARRIERAAGKPEYWLDTDHTAPTSQSAARDRWPFTVPYEDYMLLPENKKRDIDFMMMKAFISTIAPSNPAPQDGDNKSDIGKAA